MYSKSTWSRRVESTPGVYGVGGECTTGVYGVGEVCTPGVYGVGGECTPRVNGVEEGIQLLEYME